jgi:hypothetical protein
MQPVLARLVEARERLGMLSIWQPSYDNLITLNPHNIDSFTPGGIAKCLIVALREAPIDVLN